MTTHTDTHTPVIVRPLSLNVESFAVFAEPELSGAAPWGVGVCFNPGCQRHFKAVQPTQRFCSRFCQTFHRAEFRKAGEALAWPVFAWGEYKRAAKGTAENETCKAARRYLTQVQSAWLNDRAERAADARALLNKLN